MQTFKCLITPTRKQLFAIPPLPRMSNCLTHLFVVADKIPQPKKPLIEYPYNRFFWLFVASGLHSNVLSMVKVSV